MKNAQQFGSPDATVTANDVPASLSGVASVAERKSAAISARILAFVANGASVRDAFEWVLGPGYYDCLASEVYDELRARRPA